MSYNDIRNASDAYWWVYNHDMMQLDRFTGPWIDLEPHMVNPDTCDVDNDPSKNTKLEWWIECGRYVNDDTHGVMPSHDMDLDCGGDTAEEAVMALAKLVYIKYGDYA